MFALIGGGIMNYVGAERGSEEFYGRLLQLRQSDPSLRYGGCDFTAIRSDDPMILPLCRLYGQEHAIPIVNLSERDRNVQLSLPRDLLGLEAGREYLVVDMLNPFPDGDPRRLQSEALGELSIDMPAYGVRVLRFYPIQK
jgi:hypothetical protein